MLPHLGASYNLARWLTRHAQDAEDAVQNAYVKAFKAFDRFDGDHAAAWILKIVRNTCLTELNKRAARRNVISLDAALDAAEGQRIVPFLRDKQPLAEAHLIAEHERNSVHQAISQLPPDYREIIILREYEDMSYQQIAAIIAVPVGTVMSRLSRARRALRNSLAADREEGLHHEL